VTWEVYVWGLLAVVLVGGFAWYERSRPPARVVALVAALAALAVAGRVAFAPIPNVVATTDIVLITGFAVGAAPGFAVGALAAVVSNLWFGQGPWTPWQMAGWGLVGLGGAALGAATGHRLGRVGLAVACGVAALAYGALLDLSVMIGYGGEQSLDRYLAISARGVPFNLAHAIGNVVLALAAGPALVRMISRYRQRFEFRWRAAGAAPLVAVVAVALAAGPAAERAQAGASPAVTWLDRAQNADGGFGPAPGTGSSATMTGWVALGLEAAGRSPFTVTSGRRTPIDYLRSQISRVRSIGDLERTILALEGARVDSRHFGGRNLPAELRRKRAPGGSFGGQVNLTAFGVLALRSAGASHSRVARSARWLRRAQNRDGGWGFQPSAPSDADSTGAALQALAAAGAGRRPMRGGARYLRRSQGRDGGFALGGGGPSNAQSTAWAIQGLVAAGVSPARVREHRRSALDYLAARQRGDGHYAYSSSSDQTPVWVTGQTLVAVERRAFPLRPVPRPARHRRSDSDGGGSGSGSGGGGAAAASGGSGGTPGATSAASRGGGPRREQGRAGRGNESRGPDGSGSGAAPGGDARATPAPENVAADPAAAPAEGDDSETSLYVLGGFAVLAAALAAGFLWYRRRLP
jgi:Squalene-hopene cyclase C-terminal domain/Prenyltransferase and squalene oxidase repeat